MKKIRVLFEQEPTLDEIEVTVRASECDAEVAALLERVNGRSSEPLVVTDTDGALIKIDPDDVVSVSVSGKYAQLVTEKNRYTLRQPLQTLESMPEFDRFVRISRYELVNVDKVVKFDFTLGGTLRLELAGGMETWASRRNIPLIRKKLTERKWTK